MRRFLFLLSFALMPSLAFAQGAIYQGKVPVGAGGTPVPYAQITVCTSGASLAVLPCTPLASIYQDAAETMPQTNPFRTDQFGNFSFYGTIGTSYVVAIGAPAYSPGFSYQITIPGNGAGGGNYQTIAANGSAASPQRPTLNLINGSNVTVACVDNSGATRTDCTVAGPNTNLAVITSGLMAEYRILPGETVAALHDYSGNGNNATGTVGTAPTILAASGGLSFAADGAVSLPASLNSARTIQVFVSIQTSSQAHGYIAPLLGNGNSTSSNANGIILSFVNPGNIVSQPNAISNSVTSDGANDLFNGNALLTFTMGSASDMPATFDAVYINGTSFTNASPAQGAGAQTVGNYQLGGAAANFGLNTGGVPTYIRGTIYYAVFYNRILSASEVAQNAGAIQAILANRGVQPFGLFSNLTGSTILAQGDSVTAGPGTPYTATMFLNGTWSVANHGNGGETVQNMAAQAANGLIAEPFYANTQARTAMIQWGAINDILNGRTATQVYLDNSTLGRYVKKIGMRNFVVTMMSNTGHDTGKNGVNALLRQTWHEYADGLVDIGASPLGADGASTNTALFSDGTHPTQASVYNYEAPLIQQAVNRFYGNHDFTSATTYTAGAAAATATTAGSESGNTITITFGTTPANCQQGNMITIAGATPSGYNGTWFILTRSGTQVTYYTNTTGLGAISVQGTGICPEQQDADQYVILGGSSAAQNFTLESCVGYTGQNLYLKGEDSNSWTVTPFGSETIDGSASTTVANGATLVLQSVLVSPSAAGCNWIRLQNN